MLQEFWNRGYEWDEKVEDEMANRIQNWFSQFPCLNEVKVPRCLGKLQPVKCQEVVMYAMNIYIQDKKKKANFYLKCCVLSFL